jgi:tRNA (uracil-5-)-methyltransferase
LYHKTLDAPWQEEAKKLKNALGCDMIGRSRGKKIVLDKEYVTETVHAGGRTYRFRHIENSFTQPNGDINQKIITFLLENTAASGHDLLELYCGMGNLTIPLAANFRKVLGIEISKSSIASAKVNIEANNVKNIAFARMSAEEFTQAMEGIREFERLKEVDIESYDFGTVLVDPPRSGLDAGSLALVQKFDKILYISCNPETLRANLEVLTQTHRIEKTALFDQFAYTPHMEMGIVLKKRVV